MSDEIEVTAKLELAILDALRSSYQAAGTALNGVALYAAQQGGTIADVDRLIVSALNPDDELAHAGIYDVEVNVVHFTKATTPEGETTAKATPHQKKVAELAAIFDDPNHDALVALLNALSRHRRELLPARRQGRARQERRRLLLGLAPQAHRHLPPDTTRPTFDSTVTTFDSDTVTFDAAQ
jgi:hypothetical protein